MELKASKSNPPLSALILIASSKEKINVVWGDVNCLTVNGVKFDSYSSIARYLARLIKGHQWFGSSVFEEAEINHWITYSQNSLLDNKLKKALEDLDRNVAPVTYLVGNKISLGDIVVWSKLQTCSEWNALISSDSVPTNVARWAKTIGSLDFVMNALKGLPSDVQIVSKNLGDGERKEEGKFVDLPGAEMGKVVVRFPPEASGYLHIGHAKAALLNQHYQQSFKGKLIMRFDDTNPAKEKEDFEKVILEDLKLLQVNYDRFTHTSDYFDLMLELCEKLIKEGKAYVDDTDPETMKAEREQKLQSKNWNNSVEKNLELWGQMKSGSSVGQKCCVRAKIDMSSANGCLRDPTIYRCKNEVHPKTGSKYKAYPTYDFACPIVDSIEGVTHCLRTMEYHDRDDQFYWFIDALGLRKPHIWEYSRLNMTNTVLSKRKLTWFVESGLVDGWDDPRMPTVRGVLRRGMTVEGLRTFIIAQGSSKSVVFMEWDKIWAINKKIIDPIAPRYTAVESEGNVLVEIEGVKEEAIAVPKHPKNEDVGTKSVWLSSHVLIDKADAELFKEGENVTFINWGNITIKEIIKQDNKIVKVKAIPNLEDKNFKKTMKITWLAKTTKAPLIPCVSVYFDHIISKAILGKDEDFKNYIGQNTKIEVTMLGDPELASLKKSDIIQLQRKGFFICDRPYEKISVHTGLETPIVLLSIPDGHTKVMPTTIPQAVAKAANKAENIVSAPVTNNVEDISAQITEQGNKVRNLKSEKAAKNVIDEHVKILQTLKANYKNLAGKDWTQPTAVSCPKTFPTKASTGDTAGLSSKLAVQAETVRTLKASKAAKNLIDEEVKKLLALKAEYKLVTGLDWKAGETPPATDKKSADVSGDDVAVLISKIAVQGNKVRDLKSSKAPKNTIDEEVTCLKSLKSEFKAKVGRDWTVADATAPTGQISQAPADSDKKYETNTDEVMSIRQKVTDQGNKVRDLKSSKAPKNTIDEEVKRLVALKSEFKAKVGRDWAAADAVVPTGQISQAPSNSDKKSDGNTDELLCIRQKVTDQGNKVRELKSSKAAKNVIDGEVKMLINLKSEFKAKAGRDWTAADAIAPTIQTTNQAPTESQNKTDPGTDEVFGIRQKVTDQGNKVRELKSSKAAKDVIDGEIKTLISLKAEFKVKIGRDWTQNDTVAQNSAPSEKLGDVPSGKGDGNNKAIEELSARLLQQGDKVRKLKNEKAAQNLIADELKVLLTLKDEYKNLTGNEWKSPSPPRYNDSKKNADKKNSDKQANKKEKEVKKTKPEKLQEPKGDGGLKKVTRLGLEASKATNLPEWYSQVITKGELIEYYDVSGCYILRPWSYGIWEIIKDWLDKQFKSTGVKNCYFPIFVSKAALEKEKSHIADFSPEVAWVTKSGDSDMSEPIAIRPTSETVMYPAYAKWVQSHRDLPIKLNQWNNVVRWEFKHPQPFLRTREFLWQEGHTAFASQKEAEEEVEIMLGFYEKVYTDLLAIPVVPGRKTEKEKFAGGLYTLTVEAFISASGRAIQGATSHNLGQNFSKMFDIVYDDPVTHEKSYAYQNSWGLTTRTIGVMIMVHADDQGLVLPPRVAPVQIIIVPCGISVSLPESEKSKLLGMCQNLTVMLTEAGLRVEADLRDNYSPGWKFNHWELKGVPLRVEVGPKDMAAQQVVVVRRDSGVKSTLAMKGLTASLTALLDDVQASMLAKATAELHEHMILCTDWEAFKSHVEDKKIIQVPFCGRFDCEDKIKDESARANLETDVQAPSMGAKSLCIPFKPIRPLLPEDKCIHPDCTAKPQFICLFGRSY